MNPLSLDHIAGGLPGLASRETAGVDAAAKTAEGKELAAAAKDFESVLVKQLLESMRKATIDGGLLEDGTSKQIKDLYWMFLGDEIGKSGSFGIWKHLVEEFGQVGETPHDNTGLEVER